MRRGFTLIEIIVCIGIIFVIIGAIFYIFKAGREFVSTTSLKLGLLSEARGALRFMEREIIASRVSLLSIPADDNFYNSLTFKVPQSIDEDGNITWSSDITYSLNGNNLVRTQQDNTHIIMTGVTDLKFRIRSTLPQVLEIYITASRTTTWTRTVTVSLDTKIRLRN